MNKTEFSIVVPTFNRAELLINTVENLLKQSYPNFEIIIVDDGSEDHTAEAVKPYLNKVRYLRQTNQGCSAARNAGIYAATGEYIAFCDDDDTWHESFLAEYAQAIKECSGNCGVYFCDANILNNGIKKNSYFKSVNFTLENKINEWENGFGLLATGVRPLMQTLVVRKQLLLDIGGLSNRCKVAEDHELVIKLALRCGFCSIASILVNFEAGANRESLTSCAGFHHDLLNAYEYIFATIEIESYHSDKLLRKKLDRYLTSFLSLAVNINLSLGRISAARRQMKRVLAYSFSPKYLLKFILLYLYPKRFSKFKQE